MAKLLLHHSADVQTLDDKRRNAIFQTLKAPNTDGLSLLLDRGIKTDCRDSEGNTVLHQAAMDGPAEHVRLLIYQGMISKTTFNHEGLTPLHLAVRAQQYEITDILLKFEEVDVNMSGIGQATEWTPLMYVVVAGSLKLCDMVIQKGARVDVNYKTDRPTAIMLADEGGQHAVRKLLSTEYYRDRRSWAYTCDTQA